MPPHTTLFLTVEQLSIILGGCILAGILWVMKGTADNGKSLAVLQSTIDQHIMPEIVRLRETGHENRNLAQGAVSKLELLEQRTETTERQISQLWNGDDRRSGHERRESA